MKMPSFSWHSYPLQAFSVVRTAEQNISNACLAALRLVPSTDLRGITRPHSNRGMTELLLQPKMGGAHSIGQHSRTYPGPVWLHGGWCPQHTCAGLCIVK